MSAKVEKINVSEIIPNAAIANISPVSELTPAEGENNVWDFPVSTIPLFGEFNGRKVKSGLLGVIREDSGEIIGRYNKESLVPNRKVIETFETALEKRGIEFSREIRSFGNGARMLASYTLGGELDILGEKHAKELRLRNSFDGSWKISLAYAVRRLVCMNGMVGFADYSAISKRHSPEIDMEKIFSNIDSALEYSPEKSLGMLADVSVNDDQALNFLGNVASFSKLNISRNMATRIALNWFEPDSTEKSLGNNLWRLYNAGTRFLRDYSAKRNEKSEQANFWFTQLSLATVENRLGLNRKKMTETIPAEKFRIVDVESEISEN